jgi:transposase-like protein
MEISELKRRLTQGRNGNGYPPALKAEAIRYAAERQAAGARLARIADELGVLAPTLTYWQKLARRRGKVEPGAKAEPGAKLVPVQIAKEQPRTEDLVVECGPLRIRGLDLAGVVSLLRSLG